MGQSIFKTQNCISVDDISLLEQDFLIEKALQFKNTSPDKIKNSLKNRIIATLFFEPSTRTRLSFESAAIRLGAQVIGFSDTETTSGSKGETLEDTITMISAYADLIVMRHFEDLAALRATKVEAVKQRQIPIINAGDGANEHPTQALADIMTIFENRGTLDNLKIGFSGDLLYSRVAHSLMKILSKRSGVEFYLISPESLKTSQDLVESLQKNNISINISTSYDQYLGDLDVLYVNRVQKARFDDLDLYESVKDIYNFSPEDMEKTKPEFMLMHALPRINEIDRALDNHPKSFYFQEAANAVQMRMALMENLLS